MFVVMKFQLKVQIQIFVEVRKSSSSLKLLQQQQQVACWVWIIEANIHLSICCIMSATLANITSLKCSRHQKCFALLMKTTDALESTQIPSLINKLTFLVSHFENNWVTFLALSIICWRINAINATCLVLSRTNVARCQTIVITNLFMFITSWQIMRTRKYVFFALNWTNYRNQRRRHYAKKANHVWIWLKRVAFDTVSISIK